MKEIQVYNKLNHYKDISKFYGEDALRICFLGSTIRDNASIRINYNEDYFLGGITNIRMNDNQRFMGITRRKIRASDGMVVNCNRR